MEFKHIPVLLDECIEGLNIKPDGIYVDGTIGGAGHSIKIIEKLSNKGLLIGIDRDIDALNVAEEKLKFFKNYKLVHGDNILDMRIDQSQKLTAMDVVNNYSEEELAKIIYEYGEERFSKSIAKNICEYRKKEKITTTKMLTDIIEKSKPFSKDGHPAKRTFQAIRIEVNNEIKPLYDTVRNSIDVLNQNGRLCIITFHSLEDRAVKNAYNDAQGKCTCPKDLPYCVCGYKSYGNIVNKKPIEASKEELQENPRSKSAKLRIFEKNEKN